MISNTHPKLKYHSTISNIIFFIFLILIVILLYFIYRTSLNTDISVSSRRKLPSDINANQIILNESVPTTSDTTSDICIELFNLINTYRVSKGLSELLWSDDLANCASVRAKESVTTWSHTRPDGSQWYTVNKSIMFGENLARNFDTAQSVLTAWQNSPEHNENLLWKDFKYIGISEYNNHFACEFCY